MPVLALDSANTLRLRCHGGRLPAQSPEYFQSENALAFCGVISSAGGRVHAAHAPAAAHAASLAPSVFLSNIHAGHVLTAADSMTHAAPHAAARFHIPFYSVSAAHAASGAGTGSFRTCSIIARHMNLLLF